MTEALKNLHTRVSANRSGRNAAALSAASYTLWATLTLASGLWCGNSFLGDMEKLTPEKLAPYSEQFTDACMRRHGPGSTPDSPEVRHCVYEESKNKAAMTEYGPLVLGKGMAAFALFITGVMCMGIGGANATNAVVRTGYGLYLEHKMTKAKGAEPSKPS